MRKIVRLYRIGFGPGRSITVRSLAGELSTNESRLSRILNSREAPTSLRGRWQTLGEFETEVIQAVKRLQNRERAYGH